MSYLYQSRCNAIYEIPRRHPFLTYTIRRHPFLTYTIRITCEESIVALFYIYVVPAKKYIIISIAVVVLLMLLLLLLLKCNETALNVCNILKILIGSTFKSPGD